MDDQGPHAHTKGGLGVAEANGKIWAIGGSNERSAEAGGNWLTVTPAAGSLTGSGAAVPLRVQASTGLPVGVYKGTITVSTDAGRSEDVTVVLVVAAGTVGAGALDPLSMTAASVDAEAQGQCTASKLAIIETLLTGNFVLAVGWPVALRVQAVDDCGRPITGATVIVSFNNGDPMLVLSDLKDGRYGGTWVPGRAGRTVDVTFGAEAQGLSGAQVRLQGMVLSTGSPVAFPTGAVNGASFARFAPLAPGSIFSLFGRNLASSTTIASELPLPRELGQVRVTLGGASVPLFYTDTGQVNAQVPTELAPGKKASLLVTIRGVAAPPNVVTLAAIQPGIFTLDSSGRGRGVITDSRGALSDSTNPARRGEVVVVYATGLGATSPLVATGAVSPSNPPARVIQPVIAYIGGVAAPVEFSGLTPGFVGLYQVNIRIPGNAAQGEFVELYLEQNQISSNKVTLAIE